MSDCQNLPVVMPSRPLGKSGIEISSLAWGMWRFAGQDVQSATRLVTMALDTGITLFDTADIYGFDGDGFGAAESLLGAVFAANPGLRDRMVLATKGGITPPVPYDSSSDYLANAIDNSLRRLRVDRIDLWQIHRPDILTHPEEISRTVEAAIAAGKVRAFGVSNFSVSQIATLQYFCPFPIVSTQPELSPLRIDTIANGELDQAMMMDMAVLAWSPLGGGRLATPTTERDKAVARALAHVADAQSVSMSAAAYSWIMAHPARPIPIIGSQQPERIAEAADAYKVNWTRADWYAVLVAARGEALP